MAPRPRPARPRPRAPLTSATMWPWLIVGTVLVVALVATYDLLQHKHAILRNFPVIGHFR